MRLRFSNEINPFYFSIVNNTSIVQQQYKQKAVGAIMGSLSQEVLKTIKIPAPPLPIQEAIVNEVNKRRKRAKELMKEAEVLLEQAKQKAEKMILGNIN
jgi:restriction endonuclease S subunit